MYSYRNQCAIWAIKTYITQKYKNSNKKIKTHSLDNSLNIENHDMSGHDITINKNDKDALEILIEKEESELISSDLQNILNSGII